MKTTLFILNVHVHNGLVGTVHVPKTFGTTTRGLAHAAEPSAVFSFFK